MKAQKFFDVASNHFYAFTQVIHKFWFGFSKNTFCELHKSYLKILKNLMSTPVDTSLTHLILRVIVD